MLVRLYRWLLRLYPRAYRSTFGQEMTDVFEQAEADAWSRGAVFGAAFSIRELLGLALGAVRERVRGPEIQEQPAALRSPAFDGVPAFYTSEDYAPARSALIQGGILSLVFFSAVTAAFEYGVNHRVFRMTSDRHSGEPQVIETSGSGLLAFGKSLVATNDGAAVLLLGRPKAWAAIDVKPGSAGLKQAWSNLLWVVRVRPAVRLAAPAALERHSEALQAMAQAAREAIQLDAAERQRVIRTIIANLKEHYTDPAVAEKMADALLAHEKAGDYGAITDGAAFAALLTSQLRDVSHDLHLDVVYSRSPLPSGQPAASPERLARYRAAMEQQNCTFEKVEILPHNIGYLKLNSFPEPSVCLSTATAAMASVNHADAVIFDLRDNTGGFPDMVMLIAAYLFDHPEYMYNPRENTTERSWTRSPVPGNRLADKPVYVLTSARTFSGAEHFSYDLKMLKRATLVGETTGGAAHAGVFHRMDDHFGIGIPEARAINPFAKNDWAVTGVEPDVKVEAADALVTAEKLAQLKLQKK